jgi:hypothetical protein
MREHSKPISPKPRGLRAGVSVRRAASAEQPRHGGRSRTRRGSLTALPEEWRRCDMGTNHIACFGVWRRGTRRQADRLNRSGITRWHMPHRRGATLAGAHHEAANEN